MMRQAFTGMAMMLLVVMRADAFIDASLQMQLGNPSGALTDTNNHDHYLIQRSVEALDYSDHLGEPVWASWDLTSADVGSATRSSTYFTDTNLPPNFYRVTTTDYNGVGAILFNRGHLCPSEDRTDTRADNDTVFFMSNIMPQSAQNNQGVWGNLEDYCRTLAASNELLIICGPSGFGTTKLPSSKAYIASNVWKIIVAVPFGSGTALSRLSVSNRVISVLIPNVTNGLNSAWQTYLTSARQIELNTGFTFFSAVPGLAAAVYRAKIDGTPAPLITTFSPTNGGYGDTVIIKGTNFLTASTVLFNGASANFTINSSNQITATVPIGGSSGAISIITAGGLATSTTAFGVTTLPILSIVSTPTNSVVLSWPAPLNGFVLQQTLSLTTSNWLSVTNAVTVNGSVNQIVLPLKSNSTFFRLSGQ